MNLAEALLLALIQGLTEFLPVSSSGHLAVAQHILGEIGGNSFAYDILLHLATLGSVLFYFRKDISALAVGFLTGRTDDDYNLPETPRHIGSMILLASVPIAVVGIFFRHSVENAFANIAFVSCMFLVTGVLLYLTKYFSVKGNKGISVYQAFIIGCAQAAAIFPGISRSGITIAVAIFLMVDRKYAAKFSFFLSIPAIIGAVAVEGSNIMQLFTVGADELAINLAGAGLAFAAGCVAIHLLLKMVTSRFHLFSFYCIPLGLTVFVAVFLGWIS